MKRVKVIKNILFKVKYSFIAINNLILSILTKPPSVKTTDETLHKIIEENYSVSRYGDGEFSLMLGENLTFQPYSPKLASRLREIINSNHDHHIVCIPNVFRSVAWFEKQPKEYWKKYLLLKRSKIYSLINLKKEYYDSMVTRLYIDRKDKSKTEDRYKKLKFLWQNKDMIIVEGEKSRLGVGNNLFDNVNTIERVICPSEDAFSKYEEILDSLIQQDKSKLIVIALGPTATVLAYDLSLLGFQAIDIGHIDIEYEWFLQGAMKKSLIKNKYVNEVRGGAVVADVRDPKYEREVIKNIC